MTHSISVPIALCALAFASPAIAQVVDPPRDAIIVTASRLPTALDASTAALSVLEAADLERRQTVFVADALATLPGVTITQNGAFGGQATLRIRGAASEQTLVLIDGVAINDPTAPGGGFNTAFLDSHDVARIEVLRGPQSTLWGSDAIGGVVNIITRRPRDGASGGASIEGGSFGTLRVGGSLGFGGDTFDARFGAAELTTDGLSKADEDDGNREDDPLDNLTLDGRVGWNVAKTLRLEAFGRASESDGAFDSFGTATGVRDGDENARTEEINGGLAAKLTLFEGKLENVLIASRAEIERRSFSSGVQTFAADGARDSWRYQGTARLNERLTVAFGGEREDSDFKQLGTTQIDGLFALAEVKPLTGLTLTGGVRRDDHSTFGAVTTSRVGARWELRPGVGVRASWGQGFKAPTVFQITGGGFAPANPNLQPEEADGWDAAIFVTLLNGRFIAEVGAFDLETTNLINFSSAGYVNVARAESAGAELATRFAVTPAITLSGNYTRTDATNAVTGRRLIRIPEHAATIEADWRATERAGLTAIVRYNGEETDSVRPRNPTGTVASWTRIDLAGRYRLTPRLEAYARIENALDENYQDVFGYGTPGRSGYVGLRVRFE